MLALRTSALLRLGQYSQSYWHSLLISIFNSETHLPSGVKEWQIPPIEPFPSPPARFLRDEPDDEQETSYFALSVKISSFSISNIRVLPFLRLLWFVFTINKQMFKNILTPQTFAVNKFAAIDY